MTTYLQGYVNLLVESSHGELVMFFANWSSVGGYV